MTWKRALVGLAVLATVAVGLGFFWPFRSRAQTLTLPGVVEIQEVRLGSKIGGRVEKVEVIEGSVVKAGQPLVAFEVPELKAQRQQQEARVLQAQADLEKAQNGPRPEEIAAARQAATEARAHWELLKLGFRAEEIRQAKSELDSAVADERWSNEEFDRVRRLRTQGGSSASEFDQARALRLRSEGMANKARAHYEMLVAGNRPEEVQQAEASYKRAQANLDLLLAGTRSEDIAMAGSRVVEAEGKLRELDANLQEAVVRAPERVVVDVVSVRKGDLIAPNQPILRVLRADDLWVKVYVPETELGKVRLNQPATVTVDAYPGRTFQGTVTYVASESEFTPRNVQSADERRHQVFGLKVHVPDPQGIFKSGMAAEVTLPLQ
jgi:multidrug resistance efflux pump